MKRIFADSIIDDKVYQRESLLSQILPRDISIVAGFGSKLLFKIVLLLCVFTMALQAQERRGTIQGSVIDSSNGETVPYATIMVAGTSIGTMADINGYFVLRNVEANGLSLRVTAVGYETKDFMIRKISGAGVTVQLEIAEAPKTLPGVTVTGERVGGPAGMVSTTVITPGTMEKNVGIFKNDVVQYVTQLPGVVTETGVSSQYFVRGGGADQNQVLVDEMPVYNLSHAFGLFSFVDPLIVKAAKFSAGGFQAEYGGRLSSVFDIQTIDGDNRNYKAVGTFDPLASDIEVTGPVSKGNSSFVAFFRRPLFQNALNRFYSLNLPFNFYDGFAKLTGDFGGSGHISGEFLTSADNIASGVSSGEPGFQWNDNCGEVSGNYLFGDQFNMQFAAMYTAYKGEQVPNNALGLNYQFSQITTPAIYANLVSYTKARNELQIGFRFSFPNYNYTFTNTYGSVLEQSVSQVEPDAWVTYNFRLGRDLQIETGLRFDLQRTAESIVGGGDSAGSYLAEPRLSASYSFSRSVSVYGAFGIYHQRVIDLNDENMVFSPFSLLAPISGGYGDEGATHYILGVSLSPSVLALIKVEAYYKDYFRLLNINRDKIYSYEPDFITGDGIAYGVDLTAKYDLEKYYIEGNYSYGLTTRTFDGTTYYPRYDLRNQINISAGWQPFGTMWIRARWKLTSGLPYTPVDAFYGILLLDPYELPSYVNQPTSKQVAFGQLNAARLPGYQSLDLSASYALKAAGIPLTITGTVINLYDVKNVFYINNITGQVVYQLPAIWNLSLGWSI